MPVSFSRSAKCDHKEGAVNADRTAGEKHLFKRRYGSTIDVPIMRVAYGLVGTKVLVDYHQQALEAIEAGDAEALAEAIQNDIMDGMRMIGTSIVDP
ncbi:MAG: hypothetical protein AAFX39_17380 [Pseudomonadota bacterium]